MTQNFVEKYRVNSYADFVGQDIAVFEIKKFLKEFPKRKALALYGPPGTGKTSLVWAAAKANNLEVLELNSSDLRNRAKLEEVARPATEQQSLFKKGKIILMDEVDGVTGTDIGGIPELVRLIETTRFPIIMTCNDVWQSKLSLVRERSKLVEMKALPTAEITKFLQKVAESEKIKGNIFFINQIAVKSRGDIRAALNDLESYSKTHEVPVDITERRDVEESIFNILRKLFKEKNDFLDLFDNTKLSLDEILLWIEENIPKEYRNEALTKAYFALGNADIFRGRIYKNQSWRFLIYQNIFQSAGIAYSKKVPFQKFVKYERPTRVLKIWLNNQKIAKKKTIAKKYARLVHCSTKRILRDFVILRQILQNATIQQQLKLSDEEIAYLQK